MSVVSSVVDEVLKLHGFPAYALVGGLAFSESALFVGFVLPGETAVILGGVLANQGRVSLAGMLLVVVISAIVGDSVGYEVGRHFGERLLGSRIFANRQRGLEKGKETLRRHGGRAVFIGRFTAFLRAVMPGLAGTARMPYRRFLVFNAAGGIVWGAGFTLLGYAAGASYRQVQHYAGRASEVVLALAVIVIIVLVVRHRRGERAEDRGED